MIIIILKIIIIRLNLGLMNQSIKTLKDTGTCPVCWLSFKLQKKDGILHKHGHGGPNNGPCPGSYKLPSARQTASARPSSQQGGSNQDVHTAQTVTPSDQSQPQLTNDDQNLGLKHPPWIPLITRIPRLQEVLMHCLYRRSWVTSWPTSRTVSVGESLCFWTDSIGKACQGRVEQESHERRSKEPS